MAISKIGINALDVPNPEVTVYTSGSGTYTTPTGAKYLVVEMVGGGSGGGGAGGNGSNFSSIAGTSGGNTTFGTSLLTAAGATNSSGAGVGGAATVNSPATAIVALTGAYGTAWCYNFGTNTPLPPVVGASTPLGGGGANGNSPVANTGAGGSGGSLSNSGNTFTGNGGGAGGYIRAIVAAPSATYSYAVGSGGSGGTHIGTNNGDGGGGSSGIISVTAYF